MNWISARPIVLALLAGATIQGHSLAQPALTPGKAALLVLPKSPAEVQQLSQVITDTDSRVRAVAARVAAVRDRRDLAAALLEALAREQDAITAAEQARSVLLLRREAALTAASEAAARLSGSVTLAVAEWLARNNATQLVASFPVFAKGLDESDAVALGQIASMAAQQSPATLEAVTGAVLAVAGPVLWRHFLETTGASALGPAQPVTAGLASNEPKVRELTWWFAVSQSRAIEPLNAVLKIALGADSARDTAWARVARELLMRRLTKAAPTDQTMAFRERVTEARTQSGVLARLSELTEAERSTLRSLLGEAFEVADGKGSGDLPPQPRQVTARNFKALVPGLLGEVLSATGCKIPNRYDVFAAARMIYRMDGRPLEVGVDAARVSSGCGDAVRVLGNLDLAEPSEPVIQGRPIWLLLPMDASIVSCIDEPRGALVELALRHGLTPPKKTRHVDPQYSAAALKAGVKGVVIVEGVIGPSGCMRSAAVVRSVDLGLDVQALKAVSQWRFTPTLLDGRPVPVIMTVTVNFTLQ